MAISIRSHLEILGCFSTHTARLLVLAGDIRRYETVESPPQDAELDIIEKILASILREVL